MRRNHCFLVVSPIVGIVDTRFGQFTGSVRSRGKLQLRLNTMKISIYIYIRSIQEKKSEEKWAEPGVHEHVWLIPVRLSRPHPNHPQMATELTALWSLGLNTLPDSVLNISRKIARVRDALPPCDARNRTPQWRRPYCAVRWLRESPRAPDEGCIVETVSISVRSLNLSSVSSCHASRHLTVGLLSI